MLLCLLLIVIGAILVLFGVKEKNRLPLFVGTGLAAAGLALVIAALLLTASTRSDEPDPGPGGTGGTIGQDWRTWRSYSGDYRISDNVTVCLSVLDGGTGYVVYDSMTGERIGTLAADRVSGQEEIRCEDTDRDGLCELGLVLSEETVWYRFTGGTWLEGEGGGCFERME